MRLGIFGGTYDPPHVGHLLVAIDAADRLALDRLVLIPAATQPFKVGQTAAAPEHRLAMTRLMAEADARFEVDPIEIERPGLSYTVDTLEALAARHPGAERYLLLGADAASQFGAWRSPERITALARVVVLRRAEGAGGAATPEGGAAPDDSSGGGASFLRLTTRRVDVSSTEVRARVRAGKSIRGFVPDAVADYVAAARLYQ